MSAYERFRKDIDDGQYDDQDPSKKTADDLDRETAAALAGGAMSHEESRMLLLRYIDWLVRHLRRRQTYEVMITADEKVKRRHAIR